MDAVRWSIEGKVALVTGAGSEGTGRAIALRLARGGAAVAVNDLEDEELAGRVFVWWTGWRPDLMPVASQPEN